MSHLAATLGLGALVFASGASILVADDPADLLEQLRVRDLEPQRAIELTSVEIDLGPAVFQVERGVLTPATPIGGRSAEFAFIGSARFLLMPPDPIEQEQVRLFTGQTRLDVPVQQAVLVIARDEAVDRLMAREPLPDLETDTLEAARSIFGRWTEGTERRAYNVDAALLKDALGDAAHASFFAAWCRSSELEDFFFVFDPNEIEQITVGRFVPLEIDDVEAYRTQKAIRRAQHYGRYSTLRFEDLGYWDTWLSYSHRAENGAVVEGSEGFEPERYVLDATLAGPELALQGRARLELRADETGRRAVNLLMYPDLKVHGVTDDAGAPLFWVQSEASTTVILPLPTERGQKLNLDVEYGGPVVTELDRGVLPLHSTHYWYPHVGTIDRAKYDVTFHWPKKYELLAAGRRVEDGLEQGIRWERRLLELPSSAFSFEIGNFDIDEREIGHVRLRVAISKSPRPVDGRVVKETVESIEQALTLFEQLFGSYPLDDLTIVTVERGFSQGTLSFVTLAQALLGSRVLHQRTETAAHELAHQWWGNRVGWHGYRDQWLSEALADYAGQFFARYRLARDPMYQLFHKSAARGRLFQEAETGQSLESLGPIVLGHRLDSSLSDEAYQTIVYDKGNLVFSMLAQEIGEEPFLDMLSALVESVSGRVIDTATFIKAMEHMSGKDLRQFAGRFIYETGIPWVFVEYETSPSEGGWTIQGTTRLHVPSPPEFTVRRTGTEGWDVVSEPAEPGDLSGWRFRLPYFVGQGKPESKAARPFAALPAERVEGFAGTIVIDGAISTFEINVDKEPSLLEFDPNGQVLASVFDEQSDPRNTLRVRGRALLSIGRVDEAERMFRKALAADSEDTRTGSREFEDTFSKYVESLAYFDLASLLLDQDRDDEARTAIERGVKALPRLSRRLVQDRRVILEARADLRSGKHGEAFSHLKKALYLDFRQRADESLGAAIRRTRWSDGTVGDGQAYAMLAIAAHHTGHEAVCRRAAQEATRRRADMRSLIALH